jgi:hypothetical protein
MFRLLAATIVTATVGCNETVSPAHNIASAAGHIAVDYVAAMNRADYAKAAELFYYPAADEASRSDEAALMCRRLATLQERFGRIESFAGSRRVMPYIEVGVSAGTVQYWALHEKGLRLTFDVRFGSYGDGFLILELCKIQGTRWSLRAVHYGLPAIDPRSAARVAATASKL